VTGGLVRPLTLKAKEKGSPDMAQTAFSIRNVTFSGSMVEGFQPGSPVPVFFPQLSVQFRIFNRGPNHVAGLIVTTDSWASSQIVPAKFQGFGDDFENWSATFPSSPALSAPVTFEFVIFCDDFGGVDSVPRIWNTNGGGVFQQIVS
jgi:hypothetical protein